MLAEYLRRIDAGEDVDREQFIAAHAEVADALRDYFETADDVEHLRRSEPAATLDSDFSVGCCPAAAGRDSLFR